MDSDYQGLDLDDSILTLRCLCVCLLEPPVLSIQGILLSLSSLILRPPYNFLNLQPFPVLI